MISIKSFSLISEKSAGKILLISVSSEDGSYILIVKGSISLGAPLTSFIFIIFLLGLYSFRAFSKSFLSTIIFGPNNLIYLFGEDFIIFFPQIISSFIGEFPL